jgi:hypothetical protein
LLLASNFISLAVPSDVGAAVLCQEVLGRSRGWFSSSVGIFPFMQVFIEGRAFRRTAHCECGWNATPRWLRASAVVDARIHEYQTGHVQVASAMLSAESVVLTAS